MTTPVGAEGLGRFDDYAAKLERATARPSVEVGPRVPVSLVELLCRQLGYDLRYVESLHIDAPGVVTVVQLCPLCSVPDVDASGLARFRDRTAGVMCERCGTDHGKLLEGFGFVTTEHRIEPGS